MNLSDFASEIIVLIINSDYEVYRGFLAFPWFARQLTPNTIVDWAITCGVDVHVTKNSIVWTLRGLKHRGGDLPAETKYHYPSVIIDTYWYYEGEYYRRNKHNHERIYVSIEYVITEWLSSEGLIHREDGPAQEEYYSGVKYGEFWLKHGKHHRYDGPALRSYSRPSSNKEAYISYFVNHKMMSSDDYYNALGVPLHIRPPDIIPVRYDPENW